MRVNDHMDTVKWIEKVINSCKTRDQLFTAERLYTNYLRQIVNQVDVRRRDYSAPKAGQVVYHLESYLTEVWWKREQHILRKLEKKNKKKKKK